MKSIYSIIAKIAQELPPDCVRLASKKLASGADWDEVFSLWGSSVVSNPNIVDFIEMAPMCGLSSKEMASALMASAETAEATREENIIDILWTGPTATTVPVRRIEQSFCELIDSANERLFIASFVAYKADKIYSAIRSAIQRGVRVSFLTEVSKEYGGSLNVDPSDGLKKKFPEAVFYRWENFDVAYPAVVHVKCAIADECKAIVTSANLTGAAMDNNMELGLMISSRQVVSRMAAHFTALIHEHILNSM